jgi:uncharacterized protein (TIGR00369 family)
MREYAQCFGCGAENPHGLHLKPRRCADGSWESEFVPEDFHCGWPGVVHGGIIATALDEISSYVIFGEGRPAVTTGMQLEFRKAAAPGDLLLVRARPVKITRRVVETQAEALREDGSVVATAAARFLVLSENQRKELGIPAGE